MIKSYNCFFSLNIFGSQWLGESEQTFRYNGCLTVMNDIREGQQLAKMKKRIFRFRWSWKYLLHLWPWGISSNYFYFSCTPISQTNWLNHSKILLISMSTERMPKSIDNKFTINSTGCHKTLWLNFTFGNFLLEIHF